MKGALHWLRCMVHNPALPGEIDPPISPGYKVFFRQIQNQLFLNVLLLQFLPSDVSYNSQIVIVGHLRCTDFDRNDSPIFSL